MEKNKKFEISSSSNRYIQSSKLELILRGSYANIGFLLLAILLIVALRKSIINQITFS